MIAPKKSSKSKQLNYILTPKHISTPNSRDLGSAKSFKFITETNYTDNCIPTITDLKLNSFSTTVSQSASSIDMRFPAVSSPKLSQKKLKSYMKEMQQFLPEGAASDKRTEIKQKSIKRKPIVRKKTRKLESSAENTINLMKKPRIKLRKDTPNGGLGELMQLMHKKKIKGPPGGDPHQQLTERLYFTAINEPEEVFRIVASPNYSLDKLVSKKIEKKFEWNEEHEKAFRSLLRKTHSFNSMTKTRLFRDLIKTLPEAKSKIEKDWKYDKRSPYVNDLDYQSKDYYAYGFEEKSPAKSPSSKDKPISNIRTTVKDESFEIDPEERRIQELVNKTGLSPNNVNRLEKIGTHIDNIKGFEDAMKGFEMIYNWEESEALFDKAKGFLANHILSELHVDMKDINKARYSFLSGKIAYQRAYAELQKKLLMRAEEKRINLRKRQEEFQRVVFRTKMHLKRIYGREYLEKPKRILKTTACKLGSPEFTSNMIKLGYLPPKFNVSPEKLKEGGVVYYKNSSQIPEKSQNSISQWNFPQNFEKTKSEKANQKLLRLKSLCKIQSRIKGWLSRKKWSRMLKSVSVIQRNWRIYWAKKRFVGMLIKVIFDGYSQKVAKIAKKFKDTEIYFNLYSEARTQLIKRPTINFDRQPTQNLIGSSSAMSLSHLESDISQSLTKKSSIISQPSCMEIPKHVNFIEVDPAKEKYRLEVEAQRINNLLKEILNMRKEMWKHYLGTVNHAEMKDQNLTRLLSHESLYAKEIPQAKNKGIFWEESSIRLGSGEDVISHVTPESLKGKSTDQIIASLTIELSQAIISRDQAKSRYDSLQNKFDEFYKKTSADPEVDDVLQKNSTVENLSFKEDSLLISHVKFNPMNDQLSFIGDMVRDASTQKFRFSG